MDLSLLEKLVQTAAISGREDRMRKLILSETKGLFDEVRTDPMGSLLCVRMPRAKSSLAKTRLGEGQGPRAKPGATKKPLKVMLAAHMDQIGFMVRHIESNGFIRIHGVGGFDTRNLFARLVTVCPDPNKPELDLPGVMNPSGRPIHISSDEERKKVPELTEFFVDLGLPAAEVQKKVKIGDMVVIRADMARIGNTFTSQCLDNRVAVWIAIEAIKMVPHHNCEIHCAFTVQEEVGLRGAVTSGYSVKPDIGIAIDITLCVDIPGVAEEQRVTKQGDGAALTLMDSGTISDWELIDEWDALAKKKKIKSQRSIMPRGSTDAAALQRAASGSRAMTLSCPTRYVHTVTEMVHIDDLTACRDLMAAWLAQAG